MHIKKYTVAAFILIVLVGWYVYAFITQESMSIDFFGMMLPSLSVAMWVVVPIAILYIVSVMHMSFYSLLGNLKLRKYEKDYEKIIEAVMDAFLSKENRSHQFKTDKYKLLGSLIDNAVIFPSREFNVISNNKKLNEVLSAINNIRNGAVADLKKYSLSSSNVLVIQNERNRYKKGDISADDILNAKDRYDVILRKEAYVDFVKNAKLEAIEKYKNYMTKESLLIILSRINADTNTLVVPNDSLIPFFKDLDLISNDYVQASKELSHAMLPEQRIKLFEILSNESDIAMEAYLFTLFDLEMLMPAKDILDLSLPNEYMRFRAYSSLKECGKNFNINLFV
jgi:hypothetical protein